jgi:MFS family permease
VTQRQLKTGYFTLAALNTLATSYFLNYLYFFLRDHFGFANLQNLGISAVYGFIYIFAAWQCGKFAQRRGFHTSLKFGFAGLTLCMVVGGIFNSIPGILSALAGYGVVLLFIWPALEALVSENEPDFRVPHMIGIYNCTWAAAAALSYFSGGKLYDWNDRAAVFWIPAAIFFLQWLITFYLSKQAARIPIPKLNSVKSVPHSPELKAFQQPVNPKLFLKMAWLANPFAYVAVTTLIAVMPGLAQRLNLSPTKVGLFCSVWFFGRLAAFALLWKWTDWHYKFRWLLAAFLVLIASFMVILLAMQLWLVVFAQIFFGFAVGLIYYSSLFYSMDAGDTKGEHGGLHEAAIGAGIFAGPAVGAASLKFLPQYANVGIFAVSGLLVCGLVGLIWLRLKK